jgi:hypothetical protein
MAQKGDTAHPDPGNLGAPTGTRPHASGVLSGVKREGGILDVIVAVPALAVLRVIFDFFRMPLKTDG